jgi:hypothetical protein
MTKEITTTAQNQVMTIEKIRSYLDSMNMTSNLSKSEVNQFIEIASAYGLNPFKREIYATKYGNSFSIIVGFETYLKRAERSGLLTGWSVTTKGSVNFSNIAQSDITAIITIYRKDWEHPFIHEVHFSEYVQRRSDGTVNKFWKEKPMTMIKKVAMAQGFRLCFSDENGGLPYTSEEIGMEHTIEANVIESNTIEPVKEKRKYTKKADTVSEVDITAIKAKILTAMDVDALKKIWDECPECATNDELKKAVVDRKSFLLLTMDELKQKIEEATTEAQVWDLIDTVTDKEILSIAKKKIEQLNPTTISNELF